MYVFIFLKVNVLFNIIEIFSKQANVNAIRNKPSVARFVESRINIRKITEDEVLSSVL